jgi:glycosyltransferase involved in cell wall biosynthesis
MSVARQMELAVIVPCHDEEATLSQQLDALTGQSFDGEWEIVVVDNASIDSTAEIAERYVDRGVRVVVAEGGAGVAYARNRGVEATSARSVAFCDGDDVVSGSWVAAMGTALREHPFVTGTLDPSRLNPPEVATSRPGHGHDRRPTFGSIPFGRGNNCGLHRAVWTEAGGFDESFVGLEDIELSLRLAARGVEPVLVPDAVVHYRFRASAGDVWRQGSFYGLGRPALAREARELGLPAPSRFEGLRSWGWLLVHLPSLLTRAGRLQWLWVLANRVGVLRGAVRARTFHV